MARSRIKSSPRSRARPSGQRPVREATKPLEGGLVIHRSPDADRVDSLRRDHDKLLRDIAKKKAAVEALLQLASEVSQQLAQRLGPLKLNYDELVVEVGQLFTQLLGSASRLGRRDKARVRSAYFEVFADLGIDLGEDDEHPDSRSERSAEVGRDPEADRGFGRGARGATRADDRDEDWGDAGYSASKPSESHASTLRALFRRLAVALHPDKVQGEQEKAERTSWMKDVTRAYESGDVARLVEIERSLLAQAPIADDDPEALRRHELELTGAIKELRRQLRGLTEEHKLVRDSMPISLDLRAKSRMQQQVNDEIDLFVSSANMELVQLKKLQQHLQRFSAGKITLRDFLAGPMAQPEPGAVAVDLLIDEFMQDFMGFAPAARRRAPSRPARR